MLLKVLQECGYQIYIGGLGTMLGSFNADVWEYRAAGDDYEKNVRYDFKLIIEYFFSVYNRTALKKNEKMMLAEVINSLFDWFRCGNDPVKQAEYEKYLCGPEKYIDELLLMQKEHEFYKQCLFEGWNPNEEVFNSIWNGLEPKEAEIFTKINYKNKKRFFNINRKFYKENPEYQRKIEKIVIGAIENRCIQTGNNLIANVRGSFTEHELPTIGREINNFLNWLDNRKEEKPFCSYVHVFDFHYPENIMENDKENYHKNLKEIELALKNMPDMRMSVSRTLSLMHIETQLKKLWEELEKRDFFKDSYLIITADHGVSNYMWPVTALEDDAFVYHKTHFNIPFYMAGNGVKPQKNENLLENLDIPVSLLDILGLPIPEGYKGKSLLEMDNIHDFLHTEWINGQPNVIRSQIKFGYRDKKYSVTYLASLNEFINQQKCIAVYDLENDPDEVFNIVHEDNVDEIIKPSLAVVRERWYELLRHYHLDFSGKYFNSARILRVLKESPEKIKNWLEELSRFSYEDFCKDIEGKKIILFGASEFAKEFMGKSGIHFYEIWDNDAKKNNTYYMGYIVKNPYEITKYKDDYAFIIANRYEVETRIQLDDMNFEHVFLGSQILHSLE